MKRLHWVRALGLAGAVSLASCEHSVTPPPSEGLSLSVVSGNQQSGSPGQELPKPLVVKVTKPNGRPVNNQVLNFRVVSGGGSVFAGTALTDSRGIAQERWTLGSDGPQKVEVRAVDNRTGAPLVFATFTATVVCHDCWSTKAPLRQRRYGLTLAALNGKLYAMGGETCCDIEGLLRLVEVYDPASDTWSEGPPMPTARGEMRSAVINGVLYVVGGYSGNHNDRSVLSTLEAFDPASNTWSTKAPMPTARDFLAVAVVNGMLYAMGGSTGTGQPWTDVVESYDPSTDTWTTRAPMLGAQKGGAAVASGGAIYVIGGLGGSSANVQRYDPATNAWSVLAPLSVSRSFLGAGVLDGRIYAIGGYDSSFSTRNESYDPATNGWTTKAVMASPRNQLGVAALNGLIYAAGGLSNTAFGGESVLEAYRP
jgi:N-acetylneuraminic acid mutarotase